MLYNLYDVGKQLGHELLVHVYVCRRLNLGRIRKDIDNSRSNLGTLQNTHS
jgi:hypothetical protein